MTNRRHVVPHEDGWAVRKPRADRASAVLPTQSEAIDRAREILQNTGGGELTIHNREGVIRDSDTVYPGHDPNPPRDTR